MPKLTKEDLHYEYSWTVTAGDNPRLISDDANHLSRNEGYEMLLYLNSLTGKDKADLPKKTRLIVEWMLKEHYKSTAPSRQTVTGWVVENFSKLSPSYPY
ncbi:hypothetical protein [Ferribacterium limneticum]|uniref:hypothetical protein n=1 Tax=Ferribacterium limneticum TaxID=76259 RepID=UPI001CFB1B21|nr:hypothetical protein [Ferribacterium limneticum]UCV17917.1 hypothetical protein KI610_13970 [Ferribacterium limneticum]